jgi:hypothetical protein
MSRDGARLTRFIIEPGTIFFFTLHPLTISCIFTFKAAICFLCVGFVHRIFPLLAGTPANKVRAFYAELVDFTIFLDWLTLAFHEISFVTIWQFNCIHDNLSTRR